jgi:hypothetical protein
MVCLDMTVKERQSLTAQEQHGALVVRELRELHYWLSVLMLIAAEVLVVLRQAQQSPILCLHLFACSAIRSTCSRRKEMDTHGELVVVAALAA